MKNIKKISTFLAVVLIISCLFTVFATATDTKTGDVAADEIITEENYVWDAACPTCGAIGLKYGENNAFVCQNSKCQNEFTLSCSKCGKCEFIKTADGFYHCSDIECEIDPLTYDDMIGRLTLVITEISITTNEYVWAVPCPTCKSIGLEYNNGRFACENANCGYSYSLTCKTCNSQSFVFDERTGTYRCKGDEDCKDYSENDIVGLLGDRKMKMDYKSTSFAGRLEKALQGSATGILMVFSVLALLCLVVWLSKVVFHDIPQKRTGRKKSGHVVEAVTVDETPAEPELGAAVFGEPDGAEMAAVITAAIAAAIESGEYKDEFAGGFRVVSFKRAGAARPWNRK